MKTSTTSISFLSKISGILLAACLVAAIAISSKSLNVVKIGGPLYDRIVQGKDLIADVLPPPAYIIEAYLTANIAVAHPERHKGLAETSRGCTKTTKPASNSGSRKRFRPICRQHSCPHPRRLQINSGPSARTNSFQPLQSMMLRAQKKRSRPSLFNMICIAQRSTKSSSLPTP